MSPARVGLHCLLLLALAPSAAAQDNPGFRAVSVVLPQGFDQAVYKGLVGNVLDVVPMDPSDRLDLQRTNAVVSNTLFGRSLAVLAGLSNPVLMVGGLVWGLWAAANIRPEKAGTKLAADPGRSGGAAATPERAVAHHDPSISIGDAFERGASGRIQLSSISAADPIAADHPRSPVIKIWLPQRAPMLSRQ